MKKIAWSYRVENEDELPRVIEERNILHTLKRKKFNWIGLIFRKNCLLKLIIEWKIEGMERRWRRREQLLDDYKKMRKYLEFKEKALDSTVSSERAMDLS
jgi:hypothetical protein